MNRSLACLLAGVLASSLCPASVEIRGSRSCSHWLDESRIAKSTTEMNRMPLLITKSWFLGYLSGRADASEKNFLKGTDNESIFLWLDNYCRANPGKALENAGIELTVELLRQKK